MRTTTCGILLAAGKTCVASRLHMAVVPGLLLLLILSAGCAGSLTRGNLALARGDYQSAENIFQQALENDPENLTVRRRLAMTYYFMGRDIDPARFSLAVNEFENIGERRALHPEEQFYLGLSQIGKGQRTEGFETLAGFSHPHKFRLQQQVRLRAAQLAPLKELPSGTIFSEMEKAWRDGEEEDRREQVDERDDVFQRRLPAPLP